MIDTGIGRGPRDFESLQIRAIAKGDPIDRLWLEGEGNSRRDALMKKPAYKHFEEEVGPCGVVPLADASASVPFVGRSEEHTSELQSLMRISYAVFCLQKKTRLTKQSNTPNRMY